MSGTNAWKCKPLASLSWSPTERRKRLGLVLKWLAPSFVRLQAPQAAIRNGALASTARLAGFMRDYDFTWRFQDPPRVNVMSIYESELARDILFQNSTGFSLPFLCMTSCQFDVLCVHWRDLPAAKCQHRFSMYLCWSSVDGHFWDASRSLQGASGATALIDLNGHYSQQLVPYLALTPKVWSGWVMWVHLALSHGLKRCFVYWHSMVAHVYGGALVVYAMYDAWHADVAVIHDNHETTQLRNPHIQNCDQKNTNSCVLITFSVLFSIMPILRDACAVSKTKGHLV